MPDENALYDWPESMPPAVKMAATICRNNVERGATFLDLVQERPNTVATVLLWALGMLEQDVVGDG